MGVNSIGWRYDPIFMNQKFNVTKHLKEFEKIAKKLKGYTHDCTISFLDLYEKVRKNAPELRPPTREEEVQLAKGMVAIGKENNMVIHSCCEGNYLAEFGVDCSGCMTQETIERAIKVKLEPPKQKSIRAGCDCLMGNDIGAYNTCEHLCKYCYANTNSNLVKQNRQKHCETSPFLIGGVQEGDKITSANQKSWKRENEQICFLSAQED